MNARREFLLIEKFRSDNKGQHGGTVASSLSAGVYGFPPAVQRLSSRELNSNCRLCLDATLDVFKFARLILTAFAQESSFLSTGKTSYAGVPPEPAGCRHFEQSACVGCSCKPIRGERAGRQLTSNRHCTSERGEGGMQDIHLRSCCGAVRVFKKSNQQVDWRLPPKMC